MDAGDNKIGLQILFESIKWIVNRTQVHERGQIQSGEIWGTILFQHRSNNLHVPDPVNRNKDLVLFCNPKLFL